MKKQLMIGLVLALVLSIAGGVLLASAQGGDTVVKNTSWTFQNLGASTADVGVSLYRGNGTVANTDSFTVATSASFYAPNYAPLSAETSFDGSIVASSSEPLASIANQVAANSTSGRTGNATYMGFTSNQVAPTMYAPVVMKNFFGYYTEVSIQSTADSGAPINVDVKYFDQDGNQVGATQVYTVAAGSPTRVAQADETVLTDGFNGAVQVSAQDGTTPLAVVVNEFTGVASGMYNQFYSYEAFAGGSRNVTLPAVFINGYGSFNASTSVQNLGGSANPATVTWHFYDTTPGNAGAATEVYSFTEVITTSKSVYFPNEAYAMTLTDAYTGDGALDAWVGSVTLESSQDIVAIVNELSGTYLAASYTGFGTGATVLNFPLAFKNAYGFADTSFSIADVSGTAGVVNVTVDYIADTTQCPGCSDVSVTYDFTNTDSQYQPTHLAAIGTPAGSALDSNGVFVGSVKVTVNTAGKTINGIMNELLGGDVADNFTSFNAFSQ